MSDSPSQSPQATGFLQQSGIKVGLMGVNPDSIQ
jgi:hypothetical protein